MVARSKRREELSEEVLWQGATRAGTLTFMQSVGFHQRRPLAGRPQIARVGGAPFALVKSSVCADDRGPGTARESHTCVRTHSHGVRNSARDALRKRVQRMVGGDQECLHAQRGSLAEEPERPTGRLLSSASVLEAEQRCDNIFIVSVVSDCRRESRSLPTERRQRFSFRHWWPTWLERVLRCYTRAPTCTAWSCWQGGRAEKIT